MIILSCSWECIFVAIPVAFVVYQVYVFYMFVATTSYVGAWFDQLEAFFKVKSA